MTEATAAAYTTEIYGLLIDPASVRVLVLPTPDGNWTLPHIHLDERVYLHQVGVASAHLTQLLSADLTILRNVYVEFSEDARYRMLVYQLENHTPAWTPPATARWIDQAALTDLPLTHEAHRAVIAENLTEIASGQIPTVRPPWARYGWFDQATAWMRHQITAHGEGLTKPIVQTKSWGISCLLRADTDHGAVYFKVSTALPLFGNEPALMAALSARYPDAIPTPLAVDTQARWMLMRDFGKDLNTTPTFDQWNKVLARYAQLQVQTVDSIDELLAVGCLDRRLNILSSQIDSLTQADEALVPLNPDEIAQFRALAPRLKNMCSELAEFHIPSSLVHGDFHGGNITGESLLFFDWTDACVAHPFLDLCTVMQYIADYNIAGRDQLLATYFQAWTQYEPMERLQAAWQLAEPLGALHQAVSYQHILAVLEPTSKREMIWGVPEWIKRLLATMPR